MSKKPEGWKQDNKRHYEAKVYGKASPPSKNVPIYLSTHNQKKQMTEEDYKNHLIRYAKEHDAKLSFTGDSDWRKFILIEYKGHKFYFSGTMAGQPDEMNSFLNHLPETIDIMNSFKGRQDVFFSSITREINEKLPSIKGKHQVFHAVSEGLHGMGIKTWSDD
jgi:hypothetical protein